MQADNIFLAREFLRRMGSGSEPAGIVELCAEDLEWDVPGDTDAFPWIGQQSGRMAVPAFLAQTAERIERTHLEIDDILASDTRAVVLGRLAARVRRTGATFETDFALVLTISDNRITRFQMLEDSFAVSRAAHADRGDGA